MQIQRGQGVKSEASVSTNSCFHMFMSAGRCLNHLELVQYEGIELFDYLTHPSRYDEQTLPPSIGPLSLKTRLVVSALGNFKAGLTVILSSSLPFSILRTNSNRYIGLLDKTPYLACLLVEWDWSQSLGIHVESFLRMAPMTGRNFSFHNVWGNEFMYCFEKHIVKF